MKGFVIGIISIFSFLNLQAQVYNPVSWETDVESLGNSEFLLKMTAKIDKGWHLYSQELPSDDGPIATEFSFPEKVEFNILGKVSEPKPLTEYDPNFDMDLNYFKDEVTFTQKIKTNTPEAISIIGEVYFMVCDEEKCLPPEFVDLEFEIPSTGTVSEPMPETAETENNEAATENSDEQVKDNNTGLEQSKSTEEEVNKIPSEKEVEEIVWSFSSERLEGDTYILTFEASLAEGWHLYSQDLPSDEGPVATFFEFNYDSHEFVGGVEELGELISKEDPNFEMVLNYFEGKASFQQKVITQSEIVTGELGFMVCNDRMCLPPDYIEFEFNLKTGKGINILDKADQQATIDVNSIIPALPLVDLENPVSDCGKDKQEVSNIWLVFLGGFLGGLIALLTPCVFPMIPLTVSFFTKGDGGSKGVGKAVLYGFFIFAIYAVLSIPFHFNTDPEVLNEVATSVWLNIIFFIVFVVFAISFFGYFEITLPSSLTNKADSASQVGGVLGIFFMALTLALVSFSCTGPILGTVLGNALKNGPWPITAAMSGFGLALGLPFAIFATFPSMMSKLPQSGGWLNSVKVVLGFVELALAVKFLSNADLVEQWGLIKRETFFLIWVLIGAGLTAYLLGLIKFPHDSPIGRLAPARIGFAALVLAFTIYLIPGVLKNSPWNHNALSGFPPPTFYSWYDKETFHAEFMDFDEALAEARIEDKPLLIDFTGWACVNCRKMEESVWTVEEVKERLAEKFVLVSLYVDDKVKLPEDQQGVFEYEVNGELKKKKIKTIGNKWATFQTQVFNNNSQPYYVMLSPDGKLLGNPVGYTPDVQEYEEFLDCGINAYQAEKGLASN